MKATELRIGNYVYPFDDINLVDEKIIFRDFVKVSVKDLSDTNHLYPIPITEEWLLKFGFKKHKAWDDSFYYLKSDVDIFEYLSGFEHNDFHIKYVHQLQNLYFALTGEELKFKE